MRIATLLCRYLAGCAAVSLLAGCATFGSARVDEHPLPSTPQTAVAARPEAAPAVAARSPGAIFQAASYQPLFEDRRARQVGDTLTIRIEETISASQQNTTRLDRNNSLEAGISALPYASARTLGRLQAEGSASVAGNADGKTGSSNSFAGTITVLVREVLPNGNLLVAGDKQIGINGNVDVLRFSGIVQPHTIRNGNIVSSTQVAEARLEQRGRGDVSRIQGLGWLGRFFLSVAPI